MLFRSKEAKARALLRMQDMMSKPAMAGSMGSQAAEKKKGGAIKYKKGGSVSSASKRADGCAVKGKTKGRIV